MQPRPRLPLQCLTLVVKIPVTRAKGLLQRIFEQANDATTKCGLGIDLVRSFFLGMNVKILAVRGTLLASFGAIDNRGLSLIIRERCTKRRPTRTILTVTVESTGSWSLSKMQGPQKLVCFTRRKRYHNLKPLDTATCMKM